MKNNIKIIWVIVIGFCILIYFLREKERSEAKRLSEITTVWTTHPLTGYPLPYFDVEVISQDKDYIKFRTKGGTVTELHGNYRSETTPRAPTNQ